MTCRSEDKYQKALDTLKKEGFDTNVLNFTQLDLSSLDSVKDFVHFLKDKNLNLDCLVNNAGVLSYEKDHDYTWDMNINFLNTYFLTENVLKNKLVNKSGKIIGVSGLLGNIKAVPTE